MPLDRGYSICWEGQEREQTGYFIFISGIRQLTIMSHSNLLPNTQMHWLSQMNCATQASLPFHIGTSPTVEVKVVYQSSPWLWGNASVHTAQKLFQMTTLKSMLNPFYTTVKLLMSQWSLWFIVLCSCSQDFLCLVLATSTAQHFLITHKTLNWTRHVKVKAFSNFLRWPMSLFL